MKAPSNAIAGERIVLRGTQRLGRVTIKVQRSTGKRWVKVRTIRRAKRNFTLVTPVPKSARGRVKYRIQATVRGRQKTVARAGARIVKQQLTLTGPGVSPIAATPTTLSAALSPLRSGRIVEVQEYLDGSWRSAGSTARQRSGSVRTSFTTAGYPTWYRLRAQAWNGAPALTTRPIKTQLSLVPTAIAHRAGADLAPEQTFAALDRTLADGTPAMEVDVQLTSDGVPILVHDKTFKRTTDVRTKFPGREDDPIASFTLDEVQTLDAGSWFGAQFAGQKIPTLDEWLTWMGTDASLVLEVKDPTVTGNAAIWSKLGERLQTGGTLVALQDAGKLTVSSFGHTGLQTFKTQHPDVPVGALVYSPPPAGTLLWADQIHDMWLLTPRTATDTARRQRQTTSVWTANTVASHRSAIATGAERIITDNPGNLAIALNPPAPR